MQRGIIISGGDITDFFEFRKDDIVVCADKGYEFAAKKNITPDTVIGDFDSISIPVEKDINIIKHPSEKDETDTELALLYLLGKGASEIIIIGALGGRYDHALANVFLLKKALDKGVNAFIEDENTRIYLVDKSATINAGKAQYVSLFPVFGDAKGVCLSGMKYPLYSENLLSGDVRGISNEITDSEAKITVQNGILLVMEIK